MDKFTKSSALTIHEAIQAALEGVGKQYGVQINLDHKSLRYGPDTITFKGEVTPVGAEDREEREFRIFAGNIGLKPEHYKTVFSYASKSYELIGVRAQAIKYPILARRIDTGKAFCLPLGAVQSLIDPAHPYAQLYLRQPASYTLEREGG